MSSRKNQNNTVLSRYFSEIRDFPLLTKETVRRHFSLWFDRVLFAAAIASAALLPWITARPNRSATFNLLSIDGLVAVCLVGLAIIAARRLHANRLAAVMAGIVPLLLIGGIVAFNTYSPFLHFAATNGTAARREIPSVILISIDTLRRDALSCYGSGPGTPNIDEFRDDAVLFDNAYSAGPWTVPSLVSIHTGVPVYIHGVSKSGLQVPSNMNTLAERMSEAGYRAGAVVSNPGLHPSFNLTQGFNDYFFSLADKFTFPPHEPIGRKVLRKIAPERFTQSTTVITDLAIDWLNTNHSDDFFLWVHYFDPHDPYEPPEEFRINKHSPPAVVADPAMLSRRERGILKQNYDGEVRYVDHEVGRLIAAIESLGLYDNSLIILTSDHGEEFLEHGHHGHGLSLYNELIQVPLIIKLPNRTSRRGIERPVSNQFLMGTILELAGLPTKDEHFELPSLVPLLDNLEPERELPPIVAGGLNKYEEQEALVFEHHKIINRVGTGRSELYDVIADRAETRDLAAQDTATRNHLLGALGEEKTRLEGIGEAAGITIQPSTYSSPEQLRRLKALGYIQ